MESGEIKEAVKDYILKEFLPDEAPENLSYTTALVTTGILDSLATLDLVSFLEETYGIKVAAHEVGVDHMNTIDEIASFVVSKQG
jgi:acyl carrier protein